MSVGINAEVKVEDIARSIRRMSPADREMLSLLLSGEGKEIKKRLKEIERGKVKPLSRKEVFEDVL